MPNSEPTKSSTFCWKRALLRNGRTLGTCTRSRSADSCVPSSKARSSAFKLASQPVVKVFSPRTLWFQIWRQTESWKHSAAVGARQVPVSALTCPPLREAASLASGLTRIDSGLSTIVWIPACIFSDNFIFSVSSSMSEMISMSWRKASSCFESFSFVSSRRLLASWSFSFAWSTRFSSSLSCLPKSSAKDFHRLIYSSRYLLRLFWWFCLAVWACCSFFFAWSSFATAPCMVLDEAGFAVVWSTICWTPGFLLLQCCNQTVQFLFCRWLRSQSCIPGLNAGSHHWKVLPFQGGSNSRTAKDSCADFWFLPLGVTLLLSLDDLVFLREATGVVSCQEL